MQQLTHFNVSHADIQRHMLGVTVLTRDCRGLEQAFPFIFNHYKKQINLYKPDWSLCFIALLN